MTRPLLVLPAALAAAAVAAAGATPAAAAPAPGVKAKSAQRSNDRPNGVKIRNGRVGVNTISDRPDVNPGDGVCEDRRGRCSLRAAIDEANARNGALRIGLQRNRKYRIRIAGAGEDRNATGDFDIRGRVTIVGRNAVINGGRLDRIFDVAAGARLTIGRVRMAHGAPPAGEHGGAIRTAGRLELKRVRIRASAVQGDGASGGGIRNEGATLILRDSQVNRNVAPADGGAISSVGGRTFLRDTALLVNRAAAGAGIHLAGTTESDLRRARIDRNVASLEGGGIWNPERGSLTLSDTQLTRNGAQGAEAAHGGGAILNAGGDVRIYRGVLRDNTASGQHGAGGAILNRGGTMFAFGPEVRANRATRAGGAVAARGGATGLVDATVAGNAATAADATGGALHVDGGGQAELMRTVVSGNAAAASGGAAWTGGGARLRVIDATVTGNVARGAAAGEGGGALYNADGELNVERGALTDNQAPGTHGAGGAIASVGGRLTVSGTTLRGNTANRAGGAVAIDAGTAVLSAATVEGNRATAAPGDGGGVHVDGEATVELRQGALSGNQAAGSGGGLWSGAGARVTVVGTRLAGNAAAGASAGQGGGGIHNAGATVSVADATIRDNQANGAEGAGGGVHNRAGTMTVASSLVRGNAAARGGGGLWNGARATLTVTRTDLGDNTAPAGADAFNEPPGGDFTIDGTPVPPTAG